MLLFLPPTSSHQSHSVHVFTRIARVEIPTAAPKLRLVLVVLVVRWSGRRLGTVTLAMLPPDCLRLSTANERRQEGGTRTPRGVNELSSVRSRYTRALLRDHLCFCLLVLSFLSFIFLSSLSLPSFLFYRSFHSLVSFSSYFFLITPCPKTE